MVTTEAGTKYNFFLYGQDANINAFLQFQAG